ncbi:MAG: hypothetical protein CMJ19_22560 [Phycisphaeraceae bacterium]|nr:hypothetical protein [Phycisphaeraceae bacterium]
MTDNWFTKLCYSTGKTIHDIVKPVETSGGKKTTVNKKVEEKKVNENVTLRRTTIDEIEIKKTPDDDTK